MEAGLGLRQVNQVLWDALLLQHPVNHVAIAAATNQRMLQGAATAGGEIVDVADHRVGEHQW